MRLAGVISWLKENRPTVLAVQETKVQDHEFPVDAFREIGYHCVFRGQKSYNGVAMISQEPMTDVAMGFFDGDETNGPRLIRGSLNGVTVLNAYVPQGRDRESEHYANKLKWLADFRNLLENQFSVNDKVVWVGDLNVAPEPKDVHDPKSLDGHVCFNSELTQVFYDVCGWGLKDVFRKHKPEPGQFSYYDYRGATVYKNKGWRIDHILATPALYDLSTDAWIDVEPRKKRDLKPSDHTFMTADFKIED